MSNTREQSVTSEFDLNDIIAEIVAQLESGQAVNWEHVIEEHSQFSDELRQIRPALEGLRALGGESGEDTGEIADEIAADPIGTNRALGDFEIIQEIGRGGMGVVYEAQQLSVSRRVALKVLPLAALLVDNALNRFRNEVRAAASLEHPNIVSVYTLGEERGIHYYAMRLVRGKSLATIIGDLQAIQRETGSIGDSSIGELVSEGVVQQESSPDSDSCGSDDGTGDWREGTGSNETPRTFQDTVPIAAAKTNATEFAPGYFRTVARLAVQAAEALDHAHQAGVIHRDIKPGNLLLDKLGTLFVTDFGLARIEADAGITMTGDFLGTLRYMSPEQVSSELVMVDHRTDIYSLGATVFELLTLRPLYEGDVRAKLIKRISEEEPHSPKKINSAIPIDLETIVLKAISKHPNDRYLTAGALAGDLQCFLDQKPILARRPTIAQRLSKWSRRHPSVKWTAALVFVSMLATLLILVYSNIKISRQQAITNKALVEATENEERLNGLANFMINGLVSAASPNGFGDPNITVHEALLGLEQNVDEIVTDDPDVNAWVLGRLGNYLQEIAKYDDAERVLSEAHRRMVVLRGESDGFTLETERNLAWTLTHLNKHDRALAIARKVAKATEQQFGKDGPETHNAWNMLGAVLIRSRELDEAERVLSHCIEMQKAAGDEDPASLQNLAGLYLTRGEFKKAEGLYREALERNETLFGQEDYRSLAALHDIASAYNQQGQFALANELLSDLRVKLQQVVEMDHPVLMSTLYKLAAVKCNLGEFQDGIDLYEEMLTKFQASPEQPHPAIPGTLLNLGLAYKQLGKLERAKHYIEQGITVASTEYGDDHPVVLGGVNTLSNILKRERRWEAAAQQCQRIIDLSRKNLAKDPSNRDNARRLGGALCNLAGVFDEQGDYEKALEGYSEAVALLSELVTRDEHFKSREFLSITLRNRARCYRLLNDFKKSLQDAETAFENSQQSDARADSMLVKAQTLVELGRIEEAIKKTEKVIADWKSQNFLDQSPASVYALAEREVSEDDSIPDSERKQLARQYYDRAMELLRLGREMGCYDVPLADVALQEDPDFENFITKPEFQQFVKSIENKTETPK